MPSIEVIRPLKLQPTGGSELTIANRGSNNVFYGRTPTVSASEKVGTIAPGETLTLTKGFVWVINEKDAGKVLQQPAVLDLREAEIAATGGISKEEVETIVQEASVFYNLADYGTPAAATAAFEAAFAAIEAGGAKYAGTGGHKVVLVVPAGIWKLTAGVFTRIENLEIVGVGGGAGYSTVRGIGASVITVPSGVWGFTYNTIAGAQSEEGDFQPAILRNLHFKGVAGALGGVRFSDTYSYLIDNCTVSDFTTGVGFKAWGPGQYSEVRSSRFVKCLVGIEPIEENGLSLIGNLIDGSEAASYVASSFGIKAVRQASKITGDSLQCINNRIQGCETGISLTEYNIATLFGTRFEYFKTAINLVNCYGTQIIGGSITNDEGLANTGVGIKWDTACRSTTIVPPQATTIEKEFGDPGGDTFTTYMQTVLRGTVDPKGNITGLPGNFYYRTSGGPPNLYAKRSGGNDTTGWEAIPGETGSAIRVFETKEVEIPASATLLRIDCWGGGGGGGGGGSSSAVASQVGGAGGGAGMFSSQVVEVGANTKLKVTVGAGGAGGAGGANSGKEGEAGKDGVDTEIEATEIKVVAVGGAGGPGSAANSEAEVESIVFGGKNVKSKTKAVGAGTGAPAPVEAGVRGGPAFGYVGGGGASGAASTATKGGGGGEGGNAFSGGFGKGQGASETTAGTEGTVAANFSGAGGGGGGGGSWKGGVGPGAGGKGGKGGSGFAIITQVG